LKYANKLVNTEYFNIVIRMIARMMALLMSAETRCQFLYH